MKIRVILGVLGVALVTCAFVLTLARARSVKAFDPTVALGMVEKTPTALRSEMDAAGCHLEVSPDKAEYQPGESPVLTLTARNLTKDPVKTKIQLQIQATAVPSPYSRVMPMPVSVWEKDCLVDLRPGETRSFVLKTEADLAAAQKLTITMTSDGQTSLLNGAKVAGAGLQEAAGIQPIASAQPSSQT